MKTSILGSGQVKAKEVEFVMVEHNAIVLALGLMLTSRIHRDLTVAKFALLMLPAVASKTLTFIRCDGKFVGYFAVAYLDDDFHSSLLSGSYDALPPVYSDTSPHTWIIDLLVPSWINSQAESFAKLLCSIKDYTKRDRIHLHADFSRLADTSARILRIANPSASATTVVVE